MTGRHHNSRNVRVNDPGVHPKVKRTMGKPVENNLTFRRAQIVRDLERAVLHGTRQQRRKLARELVDIDIRIRKSRG